VTRSRAIAILAVASTLAVISEGKVGRRSWGVYARRSWQNDRDALGQVTADLKALWIRDIGLSLPRQAKLFIGGGVLLIPPPPVCFVWSFTDLGHS
jgi:hypothetical protein